MSISIVHYMRDRRENAFSIERLYSDIRKSLPDGFTSFEWVCRHPSKGILPRLRDALDARKAQANVNHVTGDTHYLTYFLDANRTVLTIHDLGSLKRARGLKRFALWLFWFWIPVTRSRIVVTVSDTTRQALLKAVPCKPTKVRVVHNPVSDEFQPTPKVFDEVQPRVLHIGTKPNKNLNRVSEALSGLSCRLIVIGPLSLDQKNNLERLGVAYENHVGLSRAALLEQYIRADLVMFVSICEGFGLPIVEANAVGRPVITSSISSMPEIAGSAACLVDPYNVNAIRDAVLKLVENRSYRDALVEAGFQNAERFRAKQIAENYAALYREMADNPF